MKTVPVYLPAAFEDLLHPARYKVFYGGRGSGKSWTFATVLVMRATHEPIRILCTREIQASIDDSVKRLIEDSISRLGVEDHFTIQRDEIRSGAGARFLFEGLKYNTKRIKSLEGVDICWVEEADAVSNDSLDVLIPTIRKAGSELWFSYNRDLEDDPVHKRFVDNRREDSVVKKVLLFDNPWAPHELLREAEYDAATDPDRHAHVWLGEPWSRSDAQVFRNWYVRPFVTPAEADFYIGGDFGFSKDPDAAVRCFISDDERTLFIDSEAVGHGVEIGETAEFFRSVLPMHSWPVTCDSSRPDLISHLQNEGVNATPAKKGQGSIEMGVRYLQSFEEIVIHPRCETVANEFRHYSYRTDPRTGAVLPILKPGYDHTIDALRYATEAIWNQHRIEVGTISIHDFGL